MKRSLYAIVVLFIVGVLGACSRNAENEHLPEYCQTYAGFASIASPDMFELLDDAGYNLNRFNYLSVISEIELEFEVDEVGRDIDLGGIQCFQNLTSLTLVGRSFKDISEISALSNIQSIELLNTSIVSIDSFKNLSKINNLVIHDTLTLQNVTGVGEMTKLTSLDLSDNGLVNVGELNALVNLQHLYLDNNEIVYFPSINNLGLLETLDISENNIIQLGDDLSGLSNLETLDASNNQICDISTLDDLESLRTLDLSFNNLGCVGNGVSPDFDSLENAPYLTTLKLNDNNLTSIEGLRDRDISLDVLHLHNNNLSDITPIGEYTNITELILYNNNISNINDLSGMTGLTAIDLSDNQLTSFDDLLAIPNLIAIDVSKNNITTIPDISNVWPNLSILDLHSNILNDISRVDGHPSLEQLVLYNNGLTQLVGIQNLPELNELIIATPETIDPEEVPVLRPNVIARIENSYNDLPNLTIHEDHVLTLDYDLADGLFILNSFSNNNTITDIIWPDMNIAVIDEYSFNLANLEYIDISGNNIDDLRFILNNPDLDYLNISDTNIANLSVISGVDTDDLDKLTTVYAMNINVGNDLANAFIDLPRLETVNLTNTSITSLDNCFNDLDNLENLDITGSSLRSIENSFNNIFATYSSDNVISFSGGFISVIDNSFNGGIYDTLLIRNQNPLAVSYIQDSFNDITFNENGLQLSNNSFSDIDGSFNNYDGDLIDLSNSDIETLTNSFNNATIGDLNLANNLLETVPSLNTAASITTIDLSGNILTTVAFLDGITGVTTLDISDQLGSGFGDTRTLHAIDGINNMPLLTSINYTGNNIEAITGFQNLGMEELVLTNQLLQSTITTIGDDAFSGTPLTILRLNNHEITTTNFLDNLTLLEQLYIGLDVADLSSFSGLPMELTLDVLEISNTSTTFDFGPLSNYDIAVYIGVNGPVEHLLNYSGFDSITASGINPTALITITNSFNDVPRFEPLVAEYVNANYPNLTTITNSFHYIGSVDNELDELSIDGDITVINSFHNALTVSLVNSGSAPTANFDTDSFTAMETLNINTADYTSYAFLDDYAALSMVSIDLLNADITDLNNANLDYVEITGYGSLVNSISITMESSIGELLLLANGNSNDIDVTTNAVSVLVNMVGELTLNSVEATSVSIDGAALNMDVYGDTLETINVDVSTGIFTSNGVNVQSVVQTGLQTITDVLIISEVETLDTTFVSGRVTNDVAIINDNLTDLIVDFPNGSVQLQSTTTILNLDVSTGTFETVGTSSLVTLTGSLSADTVTLSTSPIESINLTSGTINEMTISANASTMSLSVPNATLITLNGNAIDDLTLNTPNNEFHMNSSSSNPLAITATADSITITDDNRSSITIDNSSTVESVSVESTAFTTLNYGTATLDQVTIISSQAGLTIIGSGSTALYLNAPLSTLDVDIDSGTVTLIDSAASLSATTNITQLIGDAIPVTDFTLVGTSTLSRLDLTNTSLDTIQTNDVDIALVNIETDVTTLDMDALNVQTLVLTTPNMETFSGEINAATLTSSAVTMSLNNVTASGITLNGDHSTVNVNAASTISILVIDSSQLSLVNLNDASVSTLNISDATTASLSVINGSNVDTTTISASSSAYDVDLQGATDLEINSSKNNGSIDITTNTTGIDISALDDVDIEATTLTDIQLSIGNNQAIITGNYAVPTVLNVGGSAADVTFTGTNLSDITYSIGTSFDTVFYLSTGLTSFNTTNASLSDVSVTTSQSDLTVVVPNANSISMLGTAIDTVDVTSVLADVFVTSEAVSLTVSGSMSSLDIDDDFMTSIDLSGLNTSDLFIVSDALASLDTSLGNVSTSLSITTIQDNFNLTTDIPDVTFETVSTYTMNLTSALSGSMSVTANVLDINFTTPNTLIVLDGSNVQSITGSVADLEMGATTSTILALNVDATSVTITETGSLTDITYDGVHTVNEFDVTITGPIASIDTNNVVIDTFIIHQNQTTPTNVATLSENIEVEAAILGGFTEVTISYEGLNPLSVNITDLSIGTITLASENEVSITGNVGELEVVGLNIDTLTTTGLSVSDTYTMNDTLITTIDFASTTMLASLQTLNMNTLDATNVGDIITALDGTSVTLYSPLTDQDIYDYYYDQELPAVTAQEAIDNEIYNGLRDDTIDDSWAEIQANEYMDHLDEVTLRNAIDTDTLGTEEDYFQSYLTDAGITVGDLGAGEETTIRTAITTTLNNIAALMDEATLQAALPAAIEAQADANALALQGALTFTIGV
ncbi:hypothetical protein [Candidatus Xianfuyuplasma coldseepsis]|uniref:Uncharacterized protein n=1 Tax=Candidatus Xianfuyuplasma coldseepsis TaxID=2782163 RepID=A0A7L7KQN8_9MOLU|nr:hypothetical protein [Xianfuyuplasma coldseepsis]QMS84895.1 hypothetical protein G4Z02_03710 [Xianfuyuplasma coldseepsis]